MFLCSYRGIFLLKKGTFKCRRIIVSLIFAAFLSISHLSLLSLTHWLLFDDRIGYYFLSFPLSLSLFLFFLSHIYREIYIHLGLKDDMKFRTMKVELYYIGFFLCVFYLYFDTYDSGESLCFLQYIFLKFY